MKGLYSLILTLVMVMGFTVLGITGINMQDGTWEITMNTEIQGMPYPMPPVKYTQCLTKKDMNPQKQEKDKECKEISSRVEGNTYIWVIECKSSKGISRSSGKITYRGTSFDGLINTTTEGMIMKQKMSGRRTGPCK